MLVEAQIQPRLVGGRAAAGDMTSAENAQMEVEKGLRLRLAPQGITGTSYLEMDYVEPPPPVLPIDWTPDNVYIPSAPSTVTAIVNAAQDIMERLHKLDIEGTRRATSTSCSITANERVAAVDTKALRSAPSARSPSSMRRSTTCRRRSSPTRRWRCSTELRAVERRAQEDARQSRRGRRSRTTRPRRWRASRNSSRDPKLTQDRRATSSGSWAASTGSSAPRTPTSRRTIENLRQITDNLRDLTEETKRYPANVIFGAPPARWSASHECIAT